MSKKENKKKYITLNNEGCDFREMAKIMSKYGYKMNHASARNQLILAIESLLMKIGTMLNANISLEDIQKLRNNQEIHDNLADVLYTAYQALEKEKKDVTNEQFNKRS